MLRVHKVLLDHRVLVEVLDRLEPLVSPVLRVILVIKVLREPKDQQVLLEIQVFLDLQDLLETEDPRVPQVLPVL